jgi:hypothetical protein
MAELLRAVRPNPDLVEELIRKHFGVEFTSKITWDVVKGGFAPSDVPRRIAIPQKVFGVQIGWKTFGEFSDNIGFRLELWDAAYLRQAEALVEEYNKKAEGAKLELYPSFMHPPASGRQAA